MNGTIPEEAKTKPNGICPLPPTDCSWWSGSNIGLYDRIRRAEVAAQNSKNFKAFLDKKARKK